MECSPSEYRKAWQICQKIFPILSKSANDNLENEPTLKTEFEKLCIFTKQIGLEDSVQEIVMKKIEQRFNDTLIPEFWSFFKENIDGFRQFYNAVKHLYDNYLHMKNVMNRLVLFRQATDLQRIPYNEDTIFDALNLILRATLRSKLPSDYQSIARNFYECILKLRDVEKDHTNQQCTMCYKANHLCNCFNMFQETNRKLSDMTLLEPLVGQTITDVCYCYIASHIDKVCKNNFKSVLSGLKKWLENIIIVWIKDIYYNNKSYPVKKNELSLERRCINYLYYTYTKTRINQIFNIVIDYPESLSALEEIRDCLPKTDLKPLLSEKLEQSVETRLLHIGVSTSDIITAYVAIIKSLRVLDPSGLLLEAVANPIHQYLRSREDTVRCIVSGLTEGGSTDLVEELNRREAIDNNILNNYEDEDVDDENWDKWMPDPILEANSQCNTKDHEINYRNSDILSILINIYGSKELFVNEYRTLLAERLLAQYPCDVEKELRYLELLKLRFGEASLHLCEVMLKDVTDSKRINQHIREDMESNNDNDEEQIPLSAMIVSQQFWPPFKEETLILHERIEKQMVLYNTHFETLKGSRRLHWKNHLGTVNLEVEMNGRVVNFSVSPFLATILLHFQDHGSWNLEDLSSKIHCPLTLLRRKIGFWQSHGILIEISPDVYSLQEENQVENRNGEDFYVEEFESESAMASAKDQKEEELHNVWSYITGMLLNLDNLTLERIHHMLKIFAFQGPISEFSQAELKTFLDQKVKERQLILSDGLYKLAK